MLKKICIAALILLASAGLFVGGIYVGLSLPREETESFYARVISNADGTLHVCGIEENDINHRSQFIVTLQNPEDKNAVTDSTGSPIPLKDLPEGTVIRIVYSGGVRESSPAQINGALRIYVVEWSSE